MDVSIAVSLMRGQMGAVVERAVNNAVETVLSEMLKVVGVKFEELKREMSAAKREVVAVKREKAAKEKENEEIRGMLQLSEIRLKYLKQSLSSMGSREERRSYSSPNPSPCQKNTQVYPEPLRAQGLPAASSVQGRTPLDGSRFTNGTYQARARDTQPPDSLLVSATSSFDDLTDMISHQVDDSLTHISSEDLEPKEELSNPLEGAGSLTRDDECESDWTSQQPAEAPAPALDQAPAPALDPAPVPSLEPAPALDQAPAPRAQTDGVTGPAVASRTTVRPQVKEEEVEVICIKEEPEEVASLLLDCERLAQGSQGGWTAAPQEHSNFTNHTPFSFSGPGTYTLSPPAMSVSAAQRQVRAWPKDLSLYEEYKLRRAELRRHSLTRRREMEKSLPQPLLADMVRERREKTRLRVARWRAKRKLQACLMTQTGQGSSGGAGPAQTLNTQSKALPPAAPASQQVGHALPPYGSLLFNRTQCDSASAYPGPSHFNSSPSSSQLLLGHNLVENVSHTAVTSTSSSSSSSSQPQPGLSLTDSDIFQ